MISKKNIICIIALVLLTSCSYQHPHVAVTLVGNREKIFSNNLGASLNIKDLQKTNKKLYGLGPVVGLKGEITVIGEPFIASVHNGGLLINHDWDTQAIFFIYSYVSSWKDQTLSVTSFKDKSDFEIFLTSLIKSEKYKSTNVPLIIEAKARDLIYHIISKTNKLAHNAEEHQKAKHIIKLRDTPVKFLVFYSANSNPKFTHGKFHFHFVSKDEKNSGHVDDFNELEVYKISLPE